VLILRVSQDTRRETVLTHLTSAKVLGRSTIRAPPKSGVLVKEAIFCCACAVFLISAEVFRVKSEIRRFAMATEYG
jgi:hypothetical protein